MGHPVTLLKPDSLLFAIDPGNATGFAWCAVNEGGILQPETFGSAEVAGRHEAERQFDRAVASGYPLHVVIEKFIISEATTRTAVQYDALMIWGYVDGICHKLGLTLDEQTASIKSFATDAKLKRLGWYQSTPDGHANDAARHLLARATKLGKAGAEIRRRLPAA